MLRLQGFPESFKINLPYSQARKVAGNSVSVPVIKAIANEMIIALQNEQKAIKQPVEFPATDNAAFTKFLTGRGYHKLSDKGW